MPIATTISQFIPRSGRMVMEERTGSAEGYRFGFQGQETDDEVYGGENAVSYKYRVHDPRLGRFLSVDPLAPKYPFYSPYAFSGNRVIDAVELEGLEPSESLFYELYPNGPVIVVMTFDLIEGYGPTQVARDMTQTYGDQYDWFDVTTLNPEYFDYIPAEERLNIDSEYYRHNKTPEGTTLIMGVRVIYPESGTSSVIPGDKTFIDYIKGLDREVDRMNRNAFEVNTRMATEFEKLLYRTGINTQNLFNGWNLGQSLLLPTLDANPLQPPIYNTVTGLPSPPGEYQGLELNVNAPSDSPTIVDFEVRNRWSDSWYEAGQNENGVFWMAPYARRYTDTVFRYSDGSTEKKEDKKGVVDPRNQ